MSVLNFKLLELSIQEHQFLSKHLLVFRHRHYRSLLLFSFEFKLRWLFLCGRSCLTLNQLLFMSSNKLFLFLNKILFTRLIYFQLLKRFLQLLFCLCLTLKQLLICCFQLSTSTCKSFQIILAFLMLLQQGQPFLLHF